MSIQINDFLNAFSTEAKFCLSLPVFWTISIDGVSSGAINSVLSWAGEPWKATVSPADMTKNGNILVAQSVSIPSESINVDSVGEGNGGFMPSNVVVKRDPFLNKQVTMKILETSSDLEHGFMRPWVMALGIKGLISQGVSLKSTITVKQYNNKGQFRKGYVFYNAIPITAEGFNVDYDNTEFIKKDIAFIFQRYRQL